MSFTSPFTGQVIQPTDVSFRDITISTNYELSWPINGSATDNAAARIMNVTATAAGLEVVLPPADQASVGQDILFVNIGGDDFDVVDYDGGFVATVATSKSEYLYIETNSTSAGTWGTIAFGVGTSNANASALAGYGLLALSNTLNTSHPVTTFSSAYTAISSDRASAYVWTGGAGTLTLTSAVTLGDDWFMLIRNGGTGTLSVAPSGGQLINGAASLDLQPSDSAILCCSGLAFYTIGLGKSTLFNFTQTTKAVTSGTYTLTASEASNAIQKFTGTLTSNVTVIVPQTIAVYYITNQSDGTGAGYTITFSTGVSGGSTAVVPAGQQVILVCDSTNLLNASTIAAGALNLSLANGTAAVPSLNFAAEASTGVYRPGTGEFGISILGTKRLGLTASGLTITGSGTFSGGIGGGTF